jgi:predicted amidohydrolase YtcJ
MPTDDWRPPTEDEIRKRAYELYLERESHRVGPLDDWLEAEAELWMKEDPMRTDVVSAHVLIRSRRIYTMSPNRATSRAVAIRNGSIVALGTDPNALDDLRTAETLVIDDPAFTWLPAFYDTHNHLLEATRNATFVTVDRAHSIGEMVSIIRDQAARTPTGRWIQTSNAWHERSLAEGRLPTAQELDQATRDYPVIVRRGGHMAVVNSRALEVSGITAATQDPPGGHLGRRADGSLDGMLEGGAQYALVHVPPLPIDEQVVGVEQSCRMFAAAGIGTVRDPVVSPEGMRLYQAAADSGRLPLRVRPMLLIYPSGTVDQRIAQIEGFAMRSGFGNKWIKMWGLKFVMDGGPEGGALDAPYVTDATFHGHLNWDPEEMFAVMTAAVQRGWRVGTHAIGDRAVRTVLDVYERVVAANPHLPAGMLVLEHAFLADHVQRARAVRLGVHVTVQHALLYALGASFLRLWGPERTRPIMPVKSWLDEGAVLSAGTDYPIGFYEPVRTVWGMVTRQTESVGIQGPEYGIDRETALRLATVAGAQLSNEDSRLGPLGPGRFADLVAYRTDPMTCDIDQLPALKPVLTIVGGRAAFDPEGIFASKPAFEVVR